MQCIRLRHHAIGNIQFVLDEPHNVVVILRLRRYRATWRSDIFNISTTWNRNVNLSKRYRITDAKSRRCTIIPCAPSLRPIAHEQYDVVKISRQWRYTHFTRFIFLIMQCTRAYNLAIRNIKQPNPITTSLGNRNGVLSPICIELKAVE